MSNIPLDEAKTAIESGYVSSYKQKAAACGRISTDPTETIQIVPTGQTATITIISTRFDDEIPMIDIANNRIKLDNQQKLYAVSTFVNLSVASPLSATGVVTLKQIWNDGTGGPEVDRTIMAHDYIFLSGRSTLNVGTTCGCKTINNNNNYVYAQIINDTNQDISINVFRFATIRAC